MEYSSREKDWRRVETKGQYVSRALFKMRRRSRNDGLRRVCSYGINCYCLLDKQSIIKILTQCKHNTKFKCKWYVCTTENGLRNPRQYLARPALCYLRVTAYEKLFTLSRETILPGFVDTIRNGVTENLCLLKIWAGINKGKIFYQLFL